MVVPAALPAERLPAPSARAPRVPMALSLVLHGAAVLLLFAAGAAGGMGAAEPVVLIELALVAAPSADAAPDSDAQPAPESAVDLPSPEEPPPFDFSTMVKPVELAPAHEPPPVDAAELAKPLELAPSPEPPPVDAAELKPAEAKPEPPKTAPPRPSRAPPVTQPTPARAQAAAARSPAQDFGSGSDARQAAAGFLPTPPIVWEGKPRFRHPPTPAVYPPRAIELNQQGEVVVRVRLDPEGTAVEIVLHRPSGFSLLDRAALAAVRGWHFLPAMRDGRPVAAWVEIPVRFHLR
jgi:protein TonB